MTQIDQLYRLQQIDTELRQAKQRLNEVLAAQKETTALQTARGSAESSAADLELWQRQQRERDLALQEVKGKQKQTETQLYSGNVKNPKTLSDLQLNLAALGRHRAALEDELLEAMIMVDDCAVIHEAAAAEWQQIEEAWSRDQTRLQQEQLQLVHQIQRLQQTRQTRIAVIDGGLLAEYEQLRHKQRNGIAVAALQQNLCLGCRVTVSGNKVREAAEGQLVFCGSCGRILYPQQL